MEWGVLVSEAVGSMSEEKNEDLLRSGSAQMDDARSSEEYQRVLSDASFEAIFLSKRGVCLSQNLTAEKMFGYTLEEAVGRLGTDWIVPEQRDTVMKHMMAGDEFPYETIALRKDGTTFPSEIQGRMFTHKGSPLRVTALRDISERERAKEELLEKAHIIRSASSAIATADLDGNMTTLNPAFLELWGFDDEGEVVGHPFPEFWMIADRLDEIMHALVEGTGQWTDEIKARRRDGTLFDVHVSAALVFDSQNKPIALMSTSVDVTERKRAEEAMRESEERWRSLTSNSKDIIQILDTEGTILYSNTTMPVRGESIFAFMSGEIAALASGSIRKLLRGEGPQSFEASIDLSETHTAEFETKYIPMLSGGRVDKIIAVSNDISERKQAEEERKKLQEQLMQAQKMESVGRLAGGVAHDFNNLLGVILGHAELALQREDTSELLRTHLEQIRKAAGRSANLTRQLLAFARKQTVVPRILNLNDTLAEMLQMLKRLIGEDIDLVWLPGAELWPVEMDPSQLDQVLANMCVNARGAIAGVGKVIIETENAVLDEAYCAVNVGCLPGEYVVLVVSDDGCGIEEEILDHIFEPFYTTKQMSEGTGLGLATVYGIVKQNNGFLTVYSEPGQGTTFKIYLPRQRGEVSVEQPEGQGDPVGGKQETVLLVEDEPALLGLGRELLEQLGYRVLAVGTPGEAMRLAEEHAGTIDLLLTDVIMPEMNGRDLAKRLLERRPDLKRLFMSGYTANVIAHHGVLEEGVHFIPKPFLMKDLANKIREVLDD